MKKKQNALEANKLLEESKSLTKSIDWWFKEMDKLDKEMDKANEIEDDRKRLTSLKKIEKQLNILCGRAKVELQNIDNWIKKQQEFFNV